MSGPAPGPRASRTSDISTAGPEGTPAAPAPDDVYTSGRFPVCPETHDLGVRRLFDVAALLLLLDCRPGDTVLDLGAGPGFSSELLARLGYDVVALDTDRTALAANRRRPGFDPARIDGAVHVVQASASPLPLDTASVDGVLCMNVLHHLPDLPAVTAELARVLKPGCRVVFVEPGLDHLEAEETARAIREHGEDDRAFDVLAFLALARARGFDEAMLAATLQPPLRLLPLDEIALFRSGTHPRPRMSPAGVLDELQRRHAFGMLQRQGQRPLTSRHPGRLSATLAASGIPGSIGAGGSFNVRIALENTGDTLWLASPSRRGGFVTVGARLLDGAGRLVTDDLGRAFLPADLPPGGRVALDATFAVPALVPPGSYTLSLDLVDELVCWFAQAGNTRAVTAGLDVTGDAPLE